MTEDVPTVVLVCGGGIVSGKEIITLQLARCLRRAGWRVVFIVSVWGGKGEFVSRLDAKRFEYHRLRLGFFALPLSWKPFIWTLDQLRYWPSLILGYRAALKASAPRAVIHTNWHHALLLMPFLNPRRDLYWSHEVVPKNWHYGMVFRAIARRVARVVCVSHAVARSLQAVGVPASKLVVVHNGIDIEKNIPPPRGRLPLYIGIVGQIGAWKGHDDLVDALAMLRRDGVPVRLRIFGSGPQVYMESLRDRITELALSEDVEWCGFVNQQDEIFPLLDVCVVPSRSEEPLATSAIEAGAFGRPVICSSRGGLLEIVKDGETGFVVEAGRPDQLASAVKRLVRDPALTTRMGAAAREHIAANFSLDRFTRDFTQILETMPC